MKLFNGLTAIVQYRGRQDRRNVSPHSWTAMAAFDSEDVARKYADDCSGGGVWEYRAININGDEITGE